jgi:uroporphyrinogen decarboxylase
MAWLKETRAKLPDRFVASQPGCITVNTYFELRGGPERAMMDFYERPDFVSGVIEMQVEAMIERGERLLPTGIDALYIEDAYASLIGPKHFEKFCLLPLQVFCRHFKDSGVPIYIHVCGNVNRILEMLADTGVQAVEPLDPLGGVSVADAKKRIGDRVTIMGGLSTNTLRWGAPQEVKTEAAQKCLEGGPMNYILAAGCSVPPETSLDNLRSMVDVAKKSLWKQDIF